MIRINSVSSVNNSNYVRSKTAFKGNQTNPQVEQLSNVQPDFAVQTPIKYTKTGEINFPFDTKAYCYKLANGQRVVIVPQDGETVLRTYVNTGSMNEPDNIRGISHYIEHNLFNGSQGIENADFFKQVDKMGALTNASTGFGETNYFISSNLLNEGDLENKIKLHSSMLQKPLFAVEKLEKEKGIVNSEINMITSNPQNIAINKMLKNLYGIETKSTDMIGGTTDNITNLTREDVVNYYNNNYYPGNMVTVITGDVNPDEAMSLVSKYFNSTKQPSQQRHFEKFTPIQNSVREDIISDKATASTVVVGFNGPKSSAAKDRIHAEALMTLLSYMPSSRLENKLKPYNTTAEIVDEKISSNPDDNRALITICECTDENSEKVLKAIFNEIGNVVNNPPSNDEMQIIKKFMLKNFSKGFENSFVTNNEIGTSILENNQDYLNNFEQIVNEMTSEDLVNIAKKYFDVNKASVAVVHPASATEESINKNYKDISFTGSAKKEAINMDSVKEYNLANNYRIITANSKTDNVEILYNISTVDYMPSRPSAAMVLAELLNEGTMFKPKEVYKSELAKEGIDVGFSASERSLTAAAGCDTSNLKMTISSVRDVLSNPRFLPEDFEHAKNVVRDRIETSEKSAFDKLDAELYKGLPDGYTKEEMLNDLKTLTLDDVKALYTDVCNNGQGVISVAAPFDRKPELRQDVFNEGAAFKPAKEYKANEPLAVFKPVNETKVLTDVDFKNQAEIVQAYKFQTNGNLKDKATINILNTILGGNPSSRLFMDLREKEKLAYHVKSNCSSTDDIGLFTLKIGTTTDNSETGEQHFDNVQKSIDGFNRHIQKMTDEKVTDEELNNAKLSLKNALLNSTHASDDKIQVLSKSSSTPYGSARINLLFEEIDKVTAEDIQNAAKYIFSNKPTYSIVATEATLNANKEYLESLANN